MDKRLSSLIFGAAVFVTLGGFSASAQDSREAKRGASGDADKVFASLDSNKDGKPSQSEFGRIEGKPGETAQDKQQMFKEWDADSDGSVSKTEFSAKYEKE